jgi:hypothetical protein
MFGDSSAVTATNECSFISHTPHPNFNRGTQAEHACVPVFVNAARSSKIFNRIAFFLKKSDFLLNKNMEQVRRRNATEEMAKRKTRSH